MIVGICEGLRWKFKSVVKETGWDSVFNWENYI